MNQNTHYSINPLLCLLLNLDEHEEWGQELTWVAGGKDTICRRYFL